MNEGTYTLPLFIDYISLNIYYRCKVSAKFLQIKLRAQNAQPI